MIPEQWEAKELSVFTNQESLEQRLNAWGKEGWKPVTVRYGERDVVNVVLIRPRIDCAHCGVVGGHAGNCPYFRARLGRI
jgi:hypothetical protein